jgi:lipopolysaccharide transport system permease protein
MNQAEVIYEPENYIKKGYRTLLAEIYNDIKVNRWLTWQLFKRDFITLYKQSFLGLFWIFVVPLVSVGTFTTLKKSGLFSVGEIEVPYPIYAVLGISFWQLFATGLIGSSNSLVKAGSMLTQINFSKKSLVIASVGQSIVSFIIQFSAAVLLYAYYHSTPSLGILLVPVVVLPMLFFTLGLGFILALLNGIVRDIGNMVSLLMTFLMFLTPVLYPKPASGLLAGITHYNPLYHLISPARDLVISGRIAEPQAFAVTTGLSCLLLLICLTVFHLAETKISERI